MTIISTLHTAVDANYNALYNLLRDDTELQKLVMKKDFIRDDVILAEKQWPNSIAVTEPTILKDEGSFGLDGYILTYNIHIFVKQLQFRQCRDIMNQLMYRVIELCDKKTNTSLNDTCTYMQVIYANPSPKKGKMISGTSMRRIGQVQVQTHIQVQL